MDDKTKADFIQLFNQGFEEVVLPQIEEMDQKIDDMGKRLTTIEGRLDAMMPK